MTWTNEVNLDSLIALRDKLERATRDIREIYQSVPTMPVFVSIESASEATDAFIKICNICNAYLIYEKSMFAEISTLVEIGTKAWDGTPDDWVDELRGGS